jgi:hypothetical protein
MTQRRDRDQARSSFEHPDEVDDVTCGPAGGALEAPGDRVEAKGRAMVVMKWAQGLEPETVAPQRQVFADDFGDQSVLDDSLSPSDF